MVHIIEGRRPGDRWGRAEPQSRSIAAGLVLVGITGAVVLVARGAVSWNRVSVASLWIAFGMAVFLGIYTRLRDSWFDRGLAGQVATETPVVVRQGGVTIKSDARRHKRFVPARRATTLHMQDGRQVAARIVDISIAGVAVEARLTDIEFMAVTRVGAQAAGPVRRTQSGAVFGFETLLEPQSFDASFVL